MDPNDARIFHVDINHPDATDNGPASEDQPFASIGAAAAAAAPGDTVLVYPGIYRERVSPARGGEADRPITYESIDRHGAVIKASDIFDGAWTDEGEGIFACDLLGEGGPRFDDLLPSGEPGYNPFAVRAARLAGRKTLGQVFFDEAMLIEVDSDAALRRSPGTWLVDEAGRHLRVHLAPGSSHPQEHIIELASRMRCFAPHERGLGHIVVRGFVMEHAATQFPSGFYNKPESGTCFPQAGALGCRSGHHWTIEHNIIRFAAGVGLDCGYEGNLDLEGDRARVPASETGWHTIRDNIISDNGAAGIVGAGAHDCRIIGNTFERNNHREWSAPEMGAIKLHFCLNTVIEANLFRDNETFAVWLDNQYAGARVTRNVILNNKREGIFIELGLGPCLVDNNIVAYTRAGAGIYCHDASKVYIHHNLCFANAHFGVYIRTVTDRQYSRQEGQPKGVRGCRVTHNLLVDNYRGHVCLPFESEVAGDNLSDHNLLINGVHPHWEGLGSHKFAVNNSDSMVPRQALADALAKALEDAGVAAADRPNLKRWLQMPYLTLDEWRLLSGCDQHSLAPVVAREQRIDGAVAEGAMLMSARTPNLELQDSGLITRMTCPPVEIPREDRVGRLAEGRIERDFYGQPVGDRPHPGPFQSLAEGHNQLPLVAVAPASGS